MPERKCLLSLLLLTMLVFSACASDGDAVDGDIADGDLTGGDIADGDVADGDVVDCDVTDGDSYEGDTADGDTRFVISLVKEIRLGDHPIRKVFFNFNGILVFVGCSEETGCELWKSDGTESGTRLVKDIWPGASNSNITGMVSVSGKLFFGTDDGEHGRELWVSDGTTEGTRMVKDIRPGAEGSSPGLGVFGDAIVFSADDGVSGSELWTSDGTAANTILLKDINPGPDSSTPASFTEVENILFFHANDGSFIDQNRFQLWKSDGESSGTIRVKEIEGHEQSVYVYVLAFTAFRDQLLFVITNNGIFDNDLSLWRSDGTESGTAMIETICDGCSFSCSGNCAVASETFFLLSGVCLIKYRENSDDLRTVKCFGGGPKRRGDMGGPSDLIAFDGDAFFSVSDEGLEGLWRSDGTVSGTTLVKEVGNPSRLTVFGETLIFVAEDDDHGEELWQSDGTSEGTRLIEDLLPGSASSNPNHLISVGDKLFFTCRIDGARYNLHSLQQVP